MSRNWVKIDQFKANVLAIYGHVGEQWLQFLPDLLSKIALQWNLTYLEPLTNLSFNYADFFKYDVLFVRKWYFVHVMLAVCWNLEDNLSPELFLDLARKSYRLI